MAQGKTASQSPRKRLILFDIDGTLIGGVKVWGQSFLDSIRRVIPGFEPPPIAFAGRTDGWILRELLKDLRHDEDAFTTMSREILQSYLALARERTQSLPEPVRPLPGVIPCLEQLHAHPEIELALLTGNIREGAFLKLQSACIEHYFESQPGAFGDDHWDRYELPAIAVSRAREFLGQAYEGKEIVIIGDTVHDVNCGKSLGVRTIAVGTGARICQNELLAQNPDFYFPTLEDTDGVLGAILDDL